VIDPDQPDRVIGMLRRSGVISAYAQAFTQRADAVKEVDKMKAFTELSDTVILKETIKANAPLAETLVRDAKFPEGSILIYVRRDEANLIPAGSTQLMTGDTILVLSTRQHAEAVRKWLSSQC
jgi:Trk K+ transport system NAD-binding subunit